MPHLKLCNNKTINFKKIVSICKGMRILGKEKIDVFFTFFGLMCEDKWDGYCIVT